MACKHAESVSSKQTLGKTIGCLPNDQFCGFSGPHLEGSLKAKTGKDHVLYSEPLGAFSDHFIDPFDG